jgi:hypothetical protein
MKFSVLQENTELSLNSGSENNETVATHILYDFSVVAPHGDSFVNIC